MGFVQRKLVTLVMRVVSFPKTTLCICAIILLASVGLAWFGLALSTDEDQLLTPKLQFFRDYAEFSAEFPENDAFVILLEPKDYSHPPPAQRWIDLADRLTAGLAALKEDVTRVDSHVPPEAMGSQGLMFDEWQNVREESKHAAELAQFARIVGDPGSAESIFGTGSIFGGSMTRRVLTALGKGNPEDGAPMAQEVMQTLATAIKSPQPYDQWRHGTELASLANADPRAAIDPRIRGYNMIPDESKRQQSDAYAAEKLLVISVHTSRNYASLSDVTVPLNRMRAVVEKIAPDFPEFRHPIVTGRAALEADEMETSDRDTRIAEIMGLSLVFVALYVFLRNLWMVIVAELCLGTGIGWTFGWATLAVGRLNLLSLVFVIALIGIGMDYLIQILMRYRFEKKRYARPQAIWARVFRFVSAPISTACCGAAAAFFAAMLTNFHGAAELGLIAGGGLLLCLATGYTAMPALLTLFPAKVGRVHESLRYRHRETQPRAGGLRLIPPTLFVAAAVVGLFISWPPQFDPNLIKLQDDKLDSVQQVRKLQTWSAVILSNDLGKLRAARDALMSGPALATVESTESLLDAEDKRQELIKLNADKLKVNWHDPATWSSNELSAIATAAQDLAAKWAPRGGGGGGGDAGGETAGWRGVKAAADMLALALRDTDMPASMKIARAGEWERQFVREVRTNVEQFAPGPLDIKALPAPLREHLSSHRGDQPVYALYVYPKADLWDWNALELFVHELENRVAAHKAATGSDVTFTGIAPQVYHSVQEIRKSFQLSAAYALIAIFVLMLLDLRKIGQTLLALSVLALGLPMLVLMMYVWRELLHEPFGIPGSWNFANFFGLPILIGAGHEYGVFLVHRYRETLHDPKRTWRPWDVADRALLLCAIVTSASFGFLMIARHHGLQSLGWVMAVGTACIYLAGLLVLRPILTWLIKRNAVYGTGGAEEGSPQKMQKTPQIKA